MLALLLNILAGKGNSSPWKRCILDIDVGRKLNLVIILCQEALIHVWMRTLEVPAQLLTASTSVMPIPFTVILSVQSISVA